MTLLNIVAVAFAAIAALVAFLVRRNETRAGDTHRVVGQRH